MMSVMPLVVQGGVGAHAGPAGAQLRAAVGLKHTLINTTILVLYHLICGAEDHSQ